MILNIVQKKIKKRSGFPYSRHYSVLSLDPKVGLLRTMAKRKKICLLIDEGGDPMFYGNRGKLLVGQEDYQPYLIIGMVEPKVGEIFTRQLRNSSIR
jgi:hypothetical protein